MIVLTPGGNAWSIEDAANKLALRGALPGASVFDLSASALRRAKATGVTLADRLTLALPASWLVNGPAISRVLQRWSTEPQREVWLALVETLEDRAPLGEEVTLALRALGTEPYLVEAVSKVLALLVPDDVPLMPLPARTFVLGETAAREETSFVAMIDWFREACRVHETELARIAAAHSMAPLSGPQALDRLLWFDSERAP